MPKKEKTEPGLAKHKGRRKKKLRLKPIIIVSFLVILLGAAAIWLTTSGIANRLISKEDQNKEIAALVNEEPIYLEELERNYARLPDEYKAFLDKDQLLDQMIEEKLLMQLAGGMDITASDQEVEALLDALLEQVGMTEDELKLRFEEQNISLEEVKDFYKKQITITKLVNETVVEKARVTLNTIREYYEDNPEFFAVPESVNVSHLIICHEESLNCESERTKEEALELIKDIRAEVNDTNFADLAGQYSDEPMAETTGGNLPGRVLKTDPYDETFLNATFRLEPGELSEVVETVFGYHLILVYEKFPEGTLEFDEIRDQINETLTLEKQQELYDELISEKKNNSKIIKIY